MALSSPPRACGALLSRAPVVEGSHVDAALALVLHPPVNWDALWGVIHVCALYRPPAVDDPPLRNILVGADSPRSDFDSLILCAVRARASVLVASGATLRAEGGCATRLFGDPFAPALIGFRARAGLEARGALCILTRGLLEPAWPVFAAATRDGSLGGASAAPGPTLFTPVVVLPDEEARGRLVARFAAAAATSAAPPCLLGAQLEGNEGPLTIRRLLSHLRAMLAHDEASGGDISGGRLLLPRRAEGAAKHLAVVECGPSVTRDFYLPPDGTTRVARDVPVDWLLLSVYSGAIRPAAVGDPLIRRSTIEAQFERVSAGSARGDGADDGIWKFALWRRRVG